MLFLRHDGLLVELLCARQVVPAARRAAIVKQALGFRTALEGLHGTSTRGHSIRPAMLSLAHALQFLFGIAVAFTGFRHASISPDSGNDAQSIGVHTGHTINAPHTNHDQVAHPFSERHSGLLG
ncbi:hypothetical protein [Dechloromonas sp. CZR5]|uniref:hypothetical protein n=1 Tax=Dechloromonas sp. CZR5 TaxID=2608630 RepID=UPI00168AEBDE|nr:hypothetical protein [Dechloromonas sp. CZR5]